MAVVLLTAPIEGAHLFSSSTFFLHPERKVSPQEGGQVAPALRRSNDALPPLQLLVGSRQIALYCARPTRAF